MRAGESSLQQLILGLRVGYELIDGVIQFEALTNSHEHYAAWKFNEPQSSP